MLKYKVQKKVDFRVIVQIKFLLKSFSKARLISWHLLSHYKKEIQIMEIKLLVNYQMIALMKMAFKIE